MNFNFSIRTGETPLLRKQTEESNPEPKTPNPLQTAPGFDLSSLIEDIRRRQELQEAREAGLNEFCKASLSDSHSEGANEPGKVFETLQDLPTSPTHEDDEPVESVASCCSACLII